jgi:hypothetical protein
MSKMINWLRDPTFGPDLIQDKLHLTDTFHETVGRGLLKECDVMILAMYQAHSEIHVVYYLLGQTLANHYDYKCNPPRYIRRYCPNEGWIKELRMPIKYLDECYRIVIGGSYLPEPTKVVISPIRSSPWSYSEDEISKSLLDNIPNFPFS